MSYKIDRTKFIDWMDKDYDILDMNHVRQELKMGGEYIVCATSLLNSHPDIPGKLIENWKGDPDDTVDGTECELIYKQPFV